MLAASSNPTVRVLSLGGDSNVDNGLENVMDAGSTCVAGSTTVNIAFTCDHKDLAPLDATAFMVFATVVIKDSQYGASVATYPSGSGNVSTDQIGATSLSITNLSVAVQSGYWVYVYVFAYRLSVVPPTNITATPSLNTVLIDPVPQIPVWLVVKVSYAQASVTSLPAFLFTESGLPDEQHFTMNAGDSLYCVLYSYPLWATVVGGDGTGLTLPYPSSDPVNERHAIDDGETIFVYPTLANNTQDVLTGTLVFMNEYGDTSSVTISQTATPTYIPPSIIVDPSDEDLVILNGQTVPSSTNPYVIFGASLTIPEPDNVYLYAAFRNKTIEGYGEWFQVYWKATITRTGATVYRGSFNVMANEYWNPSGYKLAFPVGTNIVGTDVLIITLSINFI
jgi:hypothetical protein